MSDPIAEMKTMQSLIQNLISSSKTVEQSVERLKSIEQLLERIAGSNEAMLKYMEQSMRMYEERAGGSNTIVG